MEKITSISIHFNISIIQEVGEHKSTWCWSDLQQWICVCNQLSSTQMKYATVQRTDLENICISEKKERLPKITEKKISAMKQANHCLDSACKFV